MNKKAQTFSFGIAIMVCIFLFMIGMMNVDFIKGEVTRARTGLSCSDATISDGNKLTCLVVDVAVPYFIIIIFSAAGGLIVARLAL